MFKLALRQLTGFVDPLFGLLGKTLPVPEFSRLSKRMETSLSSFPPPAPAVISSITSPTVRDQTVEYIRKKGYWSWHTKTAYGRKNKIENTFYRLKTIFGRKILSRKWDNQDAETHLLCYLLNKMTELGMPKIIKVRDI